jgi:soluble lytic murein transglycosylase
MQIVPVTLERLREQMGRPELGLEELHQPDVGLELGMFYLRQLGEKFGGRPEVVLAAYNAGPENAERWLSQIKSDDLLDFLTTISFKETRDYVRIVLYNRWLYYDLYRQGQDPPRLMILGQAAAPEAQAGSQPEAALPVADAGPGG